MWPSAGVMAVHMVSTGSCAMVSTGPAEGDASCSSYLVADGVPLHAAISFHCLCLSHCELVAPLQHEAGLGAGSEWEVGCVEWGQRAVGGVTRRRRQGGPGQLPHSLQCWATTPISKVFPSLRPRRRRMLGGIPSADSSCQALQLRSPLASPDSVHTTSSLNRQTRKGDSYDAS